MSNEKNTPLGDGGKRILFIDRDGTDIQIHAGRKSIYQMNPVDKLAGLH